MPFTCLGCDASFSTRKGLSSHSAVCAEDEALSNIIYDSYRKRKPLRPKSDQRPKRPRSISPGPASAATAGPSNAAHYDTLLPDNDEVMVDMATDPAPVAADPPPPVVSNRSGRHVRMPARFKDFVPGSSTHLTHMPLSAHQQRAIDKAAEPLRSPTPSSNSDEPSSSSPSPSPPSLVPFTTEPDVFGLYRVYANEPTYTPQDTLESACDAPAFICCNSVCPMYTSGRGNLL
ncbi:hypothetical protein EV363DRAFT_1549883 [Boletus edulis]|nr:hypothetical protein EV363DRAFT_1549883 [Boletus edulis]